MEPLCASATQRAMERPNPTPPNSRERALSDRKRQTDTKDRPGARGALNFDGTSMRFRNPACDGKTQSNASKLTRAGFVRSEEADGYERQTRCPGCFELRWNLYALPQPSVRWKDPIQRLQTHASGLCQIGRGRRIRKTDPVPGVL